jgi:hypothetical protein
MSELTAAERDEFFRERFGATGKQRAKKSGSLPAATSA